MATAKASVTRLEYSLEISSCFTGGTSAVFDSATVGAANSSLTPGSSIARVAGKNRLPAISCAAARRRGVSPWASPDRAAPGDVVDMVCAAVFQDVYFAGG